MATASMDIGKKQDDDSKCPECSQVVRASEKAAMCEICERWFHIKCQAVSEEMYKAMKKHTAMHWYCKACEYGVGRILKSLVLVQQRQDKIEEKFGDLEKVVGHLEKGVGQVEKEVAEVKAQIQGLGSNWEKKMKGMIEIECSKKFDECKRSLDEGLVKMKENLKAEGTSDETWKDVVSKEVEDRLLIMNAELVTVQKNVEETKDRIEEEADKLNRKNNIIVYNVPESEATSQMERNKEDKEFCCKLMDEVLRVGFTEGDIVKTLRLGKYQEAGKPRPLMVKFSDGRVKNLVMEFASRLSQAKDKFAGVTISHDMTVKEREMCRKLVAEAKQKQEEDTSGEFLYRVRGLPGQMKIIKIKKNY